MKKALHLTCLLVLISFLGMTQSYITLYTDCDYRGTASKLYPGRYSLSNTSVKTNSVSSLRVPNGLKVVLYSSYNPGEGEKTRYTSDVNCLPSNWNDRANSVLIELDNTGGNSNSGSNNSGYNPNNNNNNNYDRNAVTIYSDCNYGGRMISLSDGGYNPDNLGDVGGDNISAFRIPKGFSLIAFKDKNWSGSSRTFNSDVNCLPYDWNNQISSIRVVRGSSSGGYYENNYNVNEVTIYSDCNFSGRSKSLPTGVNTAAGLGIGNDNVSSFRIPSGYKIRVYMDNDRKGESREFTRDVSCLGADWNNKISSIEVSARNGGYQSNYNDYGNNSDNYNYNSNNSNYNRENDDSHSGITMYGNTFFSGDRRSFGVGVYNLRDGDPLLANISSIKVQDGYLVEVYDDYDLRGKRLTVTHDAYGLKIFGFENNIRSFRVRRL